MDEKSQLQALDRTQPGLPIKKGRGQTMTPDYKRNGTTTLFAALNTATGEVCGLCQQKHRQQVWLRLLRRIEREIRYYITSLRPDAARLNAVIRQHWGIENKLHWVLDVGFSEDLDRKRAGHAAQNFSLLNRIALNLLKHETTFKRGIKGKRLKAAWNHPYLLKLLGI
jgi:predicted transposase YbfD/YdcC